MNLVSANVGSSTSTLLRDTMGTNNRDNDNDSYSLSVGSKSSRWHGPPTDTPPTTTATSITKKNLRKGLWGAGAGLLAVLAAVLTFPSASHALDLLSISGGAGAAIADTNSLLAGLAETGFYQAFSLVFVSEIGDKTFFIAGLLAMKTSRLISFIGSMAALST
jgi:hypothetical protein